MFDLTKASTLRPKKKRQTQIRITAIVLINGIHNLQFDTSIKVIYDYWVYLNRNSPFIYAHVISIATQK